MENTDYTVAYDYNGRTYNLQDIMYVRYFGSNMYCIFYIRPQLRKLALFMKINQFFTEIAHVMFKKIKKKKK